MDLSYTEDEQRARQRIRGWLDEHVPAEPLPAQHTAEGVEAHRRWERLLHGAGFAALHWPREYGGAGADAVTQAIFQEEYLRARAPRRLNRLALGLIGPSIMDFGTADQKRRFLPAMLTCDELWCQGFSEPESGSDLASLRTRAEPDGDGYRVTGQKVWTSLAAFASWMFALVRTSSGGKRHDGLTMLLVPLRQDGVVVRPIRQLDGEAGFAEVFFDGAKVPKSHVLGAVDDGWRVALAALVHERATGVGNYAQFSDDVAQLVRLARDAERGSDPVLRSRIAQLFIDTEVFRAHMQRVASVRHEGELARLANITKLFWSELETRIFETASELLGAEAERADHGDLGFSGDFQRRYWHARASKIYAGTNEIQRNVIATRVLGLPRGDG
ncbi:MAG: acyl-CoA dehydrogenase [Micromonosporaceae bacterium]|nr:acyl-CoA dehydrogenase [Micromonosporaceae bacterium]